MAVTRDGARSLGEPQRFGVKPVPNLPEGVDPGGGGGLPARRPRRSSGRSTGAAAEAGRVRERLRHLRAALNETPRAGRGALRADGHDPADAFRSRSPAERRSGAAVAQPPRPHPSIRGRGRRDRRRPLGHPADAHSDPAREPPHRGGRVRDALRGELRTLVDSKPWPSSKRTSKRRARRGRRGGGSRGGKDRGTPAPAVKGPTSGGSRSPDGRTRRPRRRRGPPAPRGRGAAPASIGAP